MKYGVEAVDMLCKVRYCMIDDDTDYQRRLIQSIYTC